MAQEHDDISKDNQIRAYFHCGLCLAELPPDQTPKQYSMVQAGWTKLGVQVWCNRHDVNIINIGFGGHIDINTTIHTSAKE